MITMSSNVLCHRAVREGLMVGVFNEKGQSISTVSPSSHEGPPDVRAVLVDYDCTTVQVEGITLQGKLFLSLLKAGAD